MFHPLLFFASLRLRCQKKNLSFALIKIVLRGLLYMTKVESSRFCWYWLANIKRISLPTELNQDFNVRPSLCLGDCLNPSRAFDTASDSIDLPRHAVGLISQAPLGPSVEANPRNSKLEKNFWKIRAQNKLENNLGKLCRCPQVLYYLRMIIRTVFFMF